MQKRALMRVCWSFFGLGFAASASMAQEALILEGVGIIGEHRYAFVNYKNHSFRVTPKDMIDNWLIERIEPRTIFVRNVQSPKGDEAKKNELLEINMDSMSTEPLPEPPKGSGIFQTPTIPITRPQPATPPAAKPQPQPAFKPRVIKDEDIPPGHRRVRTPFGDVLVKDESKQ